MRWRNLNQHSYNRSMIESVELIIFKPEQPVLSFTRIIVDTLSTSTTRCGVELEQPGLRDMRIILSQQEFVKNK